MGQPVVPDGPDLNLPSSLPHALTLQYHDIEMIGGGNYGTVYKAQSRRSGEIVALKKLHLEDDLDDGIPASVIREISILQDFKHPNIVSLKDVAVDSVQDICLVFEYIETDLYQVVRNLRRRGQMLPMSLVHQYSSELMAGIAACHGRRIIHRDLKPQNILVSNAEGRCRLKIADFGLARITHVPVKAYTHDVITLWYRAPEILLGATRYGPQVDMWSAGCVVAEMITGVPPFPGDSEVGTIFKIFQLCGTPSEETWPGVTELNLFKTEFPQWSGKGVASIAACRTDLCEAGIGFLEALIVPNPEKRLSARKAREHTFLRGVQ